MGVHGLTTFLHENRAVLAHALEFSPGSAVAVRTAVVIDGWSFIYELVRSADLPWVYGGEYDAFTKLVVRVVTAWIEVGLRLYFIFDGPYPPMKFATLVDRITETNIQGGLLFFRTSSSARSTTRFLRETTMLPPLSYAVCIRTLLNLISPSTSGSSQYQGLLEVHFADEEGDPYAVALAGRLHAYVAGCDSDFVVLNAEGYRGYIPLNEMVWGTLSSPAVSDAGSLYSSVERDTENTDENGFKTVRNAKVRKRSAMNQHLGRGLIPPIDTDANLTLAVTVYTPASLASLLRLPVSLLPLLGSLIGNDFTAAPDDSMPKSNTRRNNLQNMFFERQLTLVQRVTRVANTLRTILSAAFSDTNITPKRRNKKQIASVMELIDAAVTALLLRPPDTLATGEREAVVERIVEATLQYAIPPNEGLEEPTEEGGGERQDKGAIWTSDICVLHSRESCPLFLFLSRSHSRHPRHLQDESSLDSEEYQTPFSSEDVRSPHARICALYMAAYRRGDLSPRALDVASTGTAWPRLFLEDPDKESVSRSIGRPIREWCYSVLEAGVGLPERPGAEPEDEQDSEDELVAVVEGNDDEENDDDLLAPLRGALGQFDDGHKMAGSSSESTLALQFSHTSATSPKLVTEYVRRGTHIAKEEVSVAFLDDLLNEFSVSFPGPSGEGPSLPLQLWPEDARMAFLLRALVSDVASVKVLHGARFSAVLALRWAVMRMDLRAQEHPSNKEREKERWTREEAKAFLAAFSWSSSQDGDAALLSVNESSSTAIPILERNIQLFAQVNTAVDAIEQFAQVLLIAGRLPNPMLYFSGQRFHAALTGTMNGASVDENMWNACIEGQESAFAEKVMQKKKQRKKRGDTTVTFPPSRGHAITQTGTKGMYGLLAELDT